LIVITTSGLSSVQDLEKLRNDVISIGNKDCVVIVVLKYPRSVFRSSLMEWADEHKVILTTERRFEQILKDSF
jgi:hypothetical protein